MNSREHWHLLSTKWFQIISTKVLLNMKIINWENLTQNYKKLLFKFELKLNKKVLFIIGLIFNFSKIITFQNQGILIINMKLYIAVVFLRTHT